MHSFCHWLLIQLSSPEFAVLLHGSSTGRPAVCLLHHRRWALPWSWPFLRSPQASPRHHCDKPELHLPLAFHHWLQHHSTCTNSVSYSLMLQMNDWLCVDFSLYLQLLPTLALYLHFVGPVCRDVRRTVEGKILKVRISFFCSSGGFFLTMDFLICLGVFCRYVSLLNCVCSLKLWRRQFSSHMEQVFFCLMDNTSPVRVSK